MTPVTSPMARFRRSRLATIFFVKISMCSYEKPCCPGYRDLVFYDGIGMKTSPYEHSSLGDRNIAAKMA